MMKSLTKCVRHLLEKYDEVEHINKDLVKKENLTAGTGYDIKYTERIKMSAMTLERVWS